MVTQDYMSTTNGIRLMGDLVLSNFKTGVDAKTIVDSGTSYILMPIADRKALTDHIGLKCWGTGIVSCSFADYEKIPDLVFGIGGKQYVIPRESFISKTSENEGNLLIMSHNTLPFWILGLNFFDNYYVVFDQENSRVGFALSKTSQPRIHDSLVNLNQAMENSVDNM